MAARIYIACLLALCLISANASRAGPAASGLAETLQMRKLNAANAGRGVIWPIKKCDFVEDDYVQCDGDTPVAACCDNKVCFREHGLTDEITCNSKSQYPRVGCCPEPQSG